MLGSLAHFRDEDRVAPDKMPELERLMLHRLAELDEVVRKAYADFDYKRIFAALSQFMTTDLSAFYFDVRKDALYCDPISSQTRKAALTVIDHLFRCTVTWLAPMLCFTAEEAWCALSAPTTARCISKLFPEVPAAWRDDKLAEKWRKVRAVRRAVTGALEIERAGKRIGSSLEADPIVHVSDPELFEALRRHRSRRGLHHLGGDAGRRRRPGRRVPLAGRAGRRGGGEPRRGPKCARSWKILTTVGTDPQYPDVTPRERRRCANGKPCARPRSDGAASPGTSTARCTRLGLIVAAIACVLDQASQALAAQGLRSCASKGIVELLPFLDLVLTWNTGISYGWFQQEGPFGQGAAGAQGGGGRAAVDMAGPRPLAAVGALARPDHRRGDRQRASTGWPTARWPISCCCTSKPPLALQLVRL